MKNLAIIAAVAALLLAAFVALDRSAGRGTDEPAAHPDSVALLVHRVDYLTLDYPEAVLGGRILDTAEFFEQIEVAEKAALLHEGLPEWPGKGSSGAALAELRAAVSARADHERIARLALAVKEDLESLATLGMAGTEPAERVSGRDLYFAHCSQCHGPEGRGDGPAGLALDPRPADFHNPARMDRFSESQALNAIRFGMEGTAMPSFAHLPAAHVEELARYILALRARTASKE